MTALLLAGSIEWTARLNGFSGSPMEPDPVDMSPSSPPDVLLVGDSKMGVVDFDAFASAYAREGPRPVGMVWALAGTSGTAMLESLADRKVTPKLIVLGVSPGSTLLEAVLRESRSRMTRPGRIETVSTSVRRVWISSLFFVPTEPGPAAIADALVGLRRAYVPTQPSVPDPKAWEREQEKSRAMLPANLEAIRHQLSEEPQPSRLASQAAVSVLKTLLGRGARILLVRLPVSAEIRALEDPWGAREGLQAIAEGSGIPLVDMNSIPEYARLQDDLYDGCHVMGTQSTRLLASLLGRLADSLPPVSRRDSRGIDNPHD